MSLRALPPSAHNRYRGITEKSKALIFLLREIPYITLSDAQRFLFPTHETAAYMGEMMRVLTGNQLVHKHAMGDNTFIYYLTDTGRRLCDFFQEDKPKFDSETKSFYYRKRPTRPSELPAFFVFPTRGISYYSFTPHFLYTHTFRHTCALLELSLRIRHTYRFRHVLWMDLVKAKKTDLNVACFPDLLLCNDTTKEEGRVYVELENSAANDRVLRDKLDHLSAHPADWFLFLATSDIIFQNLGRRVRRILVGQAKSLGRTLFFQPRTLAALSHKILFGLWQPSKEPLTPTAPFKATALYRYDDEIFDTKKWVLEPPTSESEPRKGHWQTFPYPARRSGQRQFKLGEIMDAYTQTCLSALERDMA